MFDTSSLSKKMEFRDPGRTEVLRLPRRPEGEKRDDQTVRVCGTGMLEICWELEISKKPVWGQEIWMDRVYPAPVLFIWVAG